MVVGVVGEYVVGSAVVGLSVGAGVGLFVGAGVGFAVSYNIIF